MPLANNSLLQAGADFVTGVAPSNTQDGPHGVPNPFGAGAGSFEPNTQILDPSNDPLFAGSDLQVNGQSPEDKAAADALSAGTGAGVNPGDVGTPAVAGSALNVINAAKSLLGKPYVWGGTTINGVDCSGLLYYAFNKAGIKMPRYRAVDYGKMGQQVDSSAARPGDIVYWNEAGDVDHVGIYMGNGYVLNAPHTGTTVQINKVWGHPTYRRLINDNGFGLLASPDGSSATQSYNGQPAGQLFLGDVPHGPGIDSTAPIIADAPRADYRMKAEL